MRCLVELIPLRHARPSRLAGLVLAVLCVLTTAAHAAPVFSIGAGSRFDATSPPAEAHGWVVIGRPDDDGVLLVHLPPRRGSAHGETAGVARRARVLESRPIGMAAHGRELVMVFEGEPRRVLSIHAVPSALDGIWQDSPAGRMTPLPPLPADGELAGLAMPAGRAAALIRLPDGWRLLELIDGGWTERPAPSGLAVDAGVAVFAEEASLSIVRSGTEPAVFTRPDPDSGWTERRLAIPAASRPIGLIRGEVVAAVPSGAVSDGADSDGLVSDLQGSPGLELVLAGAGGVSRLAEIGLPDSAVDGGPGLAVIPDESGRLAMVWMDRDDEGVVTSMVRELSLSTGRVLYDGPVSRVLPVSPEEFRLLAAGLIVVMVVSLFVVLRPGGEGRPIVLPPGTALAFPGQRFSASVLDVAVCALIVSALFGVPFIDIVTGAVLVSPGDAWVTIPAVFAVGAVYGTVMDRLAAGTIGKLILGCRVLRATVGPPGRGRRLGWGAAFVRNIVKWALPPVAALAMLDNTGRHRGDVAAGAVVVTRLADDEPGPDGDQDGDPDRGRKNPPSAPPSEGDA